MRSQNLHPPETIMAMLNMNRSTVIALARKGVIPSVRVGKCYRFSLQKVVEHLGIEMVPEIVEFMARIPEDEEAVS